MTTARTARRPGRTGLAVVALAGLALVAGWLLIMGMAGSDPVVDAGVDTSRDDRLPQTLTIFPDDVQPEQTVTDDDPVELGLAFTPRVAGQVTALRFYKPAAAVGAEHSGRLWTAAGRLLVEVAFDDPSAAGWQTVALAEPVPLASGQTYVVSYHAAAGYASTHEAFLRPSHGAWFELASDAGSFSYGDAGSFPQTVHLSSNYFADVAFQPETPVDVTTDEDSPAHSPFVVLDQFGYLPGAEKVAVLRDPQVGFDGDQKFSPGAEYAVVDAATGAEVFVGSPTQWNGGSVDDSSGDRAAWFDFSAVTQPGEYFVLDTDNGARSPTFRIGADVYEEVLRAAVRTFYYQRAGTPKVAEYAGEGWMDAASHIGPLQDANARRWGAADDPETERDLSGGWYDAGDYNRYTSWAASSVITLLRAYVEAPAAFTDDVGVPESGNGVPDLVDEVRWGMEWLEKMQNPDGSMLSVLGVDHASPPSAATGPSRYGDPSTSATHSAAAAFAYGSIVLRSLAPLDESLERYADTLLDRAELAWQWAEANPDVLFFNNDLSAGTQGLAAGQQETDDYGRLSRRFQAAVYLYDATARARYRTVVDDTYQNLHLLEWGYAYPFEPDQQDALLHYAALPSATAAVADAIRDTYATSMDSPENGGAVTQAVDPYRAPITEYTWGSNATKARQGALFWNLHTYDVPSEASSEVSEAAAGYLHYLHGTNPLGLVYLTNMGPLGAESSANELYHSWFADGSPSWDRVGESTFGPPPGFVTGGPNPGYEPDVCCPSDCAGGDSGCPVGPDEPPQGQPAQKSYLDFNDGWPANSWSVTENSNGYQAAYIRLLSKYVQIEPGSAGPTGTAGTPLVSRGVPAFASTGVAADAVDDDYDTTWNPDVNTSWIALDVSGIPAAQRDQLMLTWYVGQDDGYSTAPLQGVCPAWEGRPLLADYTIEVSPASGGQAPPKDGWQTLTSVTGNHALFRQHVLDAEDMNWVRISGVGPNGLALNIDITAGADRPTDGWLFLGDSITARWAGHSSVYAEDGALVRSFSDLVAEQTSQRRHPVAVNAGTSCAKSFDALAWMDDALAEFPGRYVALSFGTNDGWGGYGNADEFYDHMSALADVVVAAGKVPVVPSIPWPNNGGDWAAGTRELNAAIEKLSQSRDDVVAGPDLYALTRGRPELFGPDGDVHPNGAGIAAMRAAWADLAVREMYADDAR